MTTKKEKRMKYMEVSDCLALFKRREGRQTTLRSAYVIIGASYMTCVLVIHSYWRRGQWHKSGGGPTRLMRGVCVIGAVLVACAFTVEYN